MIKIQKRAIMIIFIIIITINKKAWTETPLLSFRFNLTILLMMADKWRASKIPSASNQTQYSLKSAKTHFQA